MKPHGKRMLLNPPGYETTAAIVAEVENTSKWKPGRDRDGTLITGKWDFEPEYTLQISDCQRVVTFSLHFDTPAGRKASLTKVNRMIDALTVFRNGLMEEHILYVERGEALAAKKAESEDDE